MKSKEPIGIPLETLLDDEGFKRNYLIFMDETHGDKSLKAALADMLIQNASGNRTKKSPLGKSQRWAVKQLRKNTKKNQPSAGCKLLN